MVEVHSHASTFARRTPSPADTISSNRRRGIRTADRHLKLYLAWWPGTSGLIVRLSNAVPLKITVAGATISQKIPPGRVVPHAPAGATSFTWRAYSSSSLPPRPLSPSSVCRARSLDLDVRRLARVGWGTAAAALVVSVGGSIPRRSALQCDWSSISRVRLRAIQPSFAPMAVPAETATPMTTVRSPMVRSERSPTAIK